MRRYWRWILSFALLLGVYGFSQYWQGQRSDVFEATLLDFLPARVERIDIESQKYGAFSLLRYPERWLFTQQHLNEEAVTPVVEHLLQTLRDLRTTRLVSDKQNEWVRYHVTPQQGVMLCLEQEGERPSCIVVGKTHFDAEQQQIQTYIRLPERTETYAVNGQALAGILDGQNHYFRHKQLVQQALNPHAVSWQQDSLSHRLQIDSLGAPILDNRPLSAEDSLVALTYFASWRDVKGQRQADNVDELALQSLPHQQLTAYWPSGDSVVVTCYQDTTRTTPYIIKTSQYPRTWISSDSAGVYQQLWGSWSKWIVNNE